MKTQLTTIIFSLLFLFFSSFAGSIETVTLQLKWKHQFQFAGYYAAREKGFYKDVGLDVIIHEAKPGINPIQQVIDGHANFGVGTSEIVLEHNKGAPVVVLAVIFQHSPLGLAVTKTDDLLTLQDIVDNRVMIEPNSAELFAYLELEGIKKERLTLTEHTFDIKDLITGNVKAMSVYVTDEPFSLREKQHEYAIFEPRLGGIDFYGDNLFTTQHELSRNPKRTKAFRDATIRGWKYAMQNPEEIIDLIYSRYSKRHSKEHLRFEAAQMRRLMQPNLVEPGYMHEGRWQHIANTYKNQGRLPDDYTLDGLLFDPSQEININELRPWLISGAVLIITIIISILIFYRFNRRLASSKMWFRKLVDNAPNAMIISDLEGNVTDWNNQAEEIFGWRKNEILGKNAFKLMVPLKNLGQVRAFIGAEFKKNETIKSKIWNITKVGKPILCQWSNTLVHSNKKDKDFIISMAVDVTKEKLMEDKLKKQAYTDPLTGLNNRHIFYIKLNHAINLAKRKHTKLALLFIDLDGFKSINDSYGHEAGDKVLKLITQRIKESVRETDIIARIGGDEFVVLLDDCKNEDIANKISQKILRATIKPIILTESRIIAISASIGISIYPDYETNAEELLKIADLAMYEVKRGSRRNAYIPSVEKK